MCCLPVYANELRFKRVRCSDAGTHAAFQLCTAPLRPPGGEGEIHYSAFEGPDVDFSCECDVGPSPHGKEGIWGEGRRLFFSGSGMTG